MEELEEDYFDSEDYFFKSDNINDDDVADNIIDSEEKITDIVIEVKDEVINEVAEVKENLKTEVAALSKAEKRALLRTGILPVIKPNVYTRFEDENPQFGK